MDYRYEVRRHGSLIFTSDPMPLEQAEQEAEDRIEPGITTEVFEDEPDFYGFREEEDALPY